MTLPKRSGANDPGTDEYGVRGEGKVGAHLWLPPPLLSERILEAREASSLLKRSERPRSQSAAICIAWSCSVRRQRENVVGCERTRGRRGEGEEEKRRRRRGEGEKGRRREGRRGDGGGRVYFGGIPGITPLPGRVTPRLSAAQAIPTVLCPKNFW